MEGFQSPANAQLGLTSSELLKITHEMGLFSRINLHDAKKLTVIKRITKD